MNTRTFIMISTIKINPFGKEFITFLGNNAQLTRWNEPFRKSIGENSPLGFPFKDEFYARILDKETPKSSSKKMKPKYKPFFKVMQPFFEESIQADFELKLPKVIKKGNFTLELEMKYFQPKVTRTVQLSSQLSLEDLHDVIINSIDFDDDHLYAFYMDKNKRNSYGRFSEYGEPPFCERF
jgi:hypothetical protein